MKRIKQFGLCLIMGITMLSLIGCSDAKEGEKYSIEGLKETAKIQFENKAIYVEDIYNQTLYENGGGGSFYIEIQTLGKDYSICTNAGGYEAGLFFKDGIYSGYSVLIDEKKYYEIEGDVSNSVFLQDYQMIKDLLNIDYSSMSLKEISFASKETSANEDIVALSDSSQSHTYFLYLDPNTGKCNRMQIALSGEDGTVSEMLMITWEDLSVKGFYYPEEIKTLEKVTMTGEEFEDFSFNFLFGSLINDSIINSANAQNKSNTTITEMEDHDHNHSHEGHNHSHEGHNH